MANKLDIIKNAKPGDFISTKMDVDGVINLISLDPESKLKIIATAINEYGETNYTLCLYPDNKFSCFKLNFLPSFKNEDYINFIIDNNSDYFVSKIFKINLIDDFNSFNLKYVRWLNYSRILSVISNAPVSVCEGCWCKICKDYYMYAQPNQPDGTLICYSCRQNPMRGYY